ncbi:MAG: CopG family ribbon-helix-helix protein [Sphingomonadaceae bacterium]
MEKSAVITARLDPETLGELDRLATYHDRSRAWIVARAVKDYVREETQFFAYLQEAEDAIDRGDYYTQEEVEAWFAAKKAARKRHE